MTELHQRAGATNSNTNGSGNPIPVPAASVATTATETSRWSGTFKLLVGPLLMYSVLVGVCGLQSVGVFGKGYHLMSDKAKDTTIFSWHPFLMVLSFITLAGNAALIKKTKGLDNMRLHGNLMSGAIICAIIGWWAIYDTKIFKNGKVNDFLNKSPNHGIWGIIVILGYLFVGFGGFLAFHPEYGLSSLKSNQTLRLIHKWSGRVLTALAWYCCTTGCRMSFSKYLSVNGAQIPTTYLCLELPLIIIGYFVLI